MFNDYIQYLNSLHNYNAQNENSYAEKNFDSQYYNKVMVKINLSDYFVNQLNDSEPHVIRARQCGSMYEIFRMTDDDHHKKEAAAEEILGCMEKAVDSFSFYVKIDGKVNRAALERYRLEIEQFVRDIKDKYMEVFGAFNGTAKVVRPEYVQEYS